jgi:hypothetical protein
MILQIEDTRLSAAAACAPAHDLPVGFLGVPGAPANRRRLAPNHVQLVQEKSVHVYGAQLQLQVADQGQKQGINGSMAKAIGTALPPVTTGADASGVPPRGRPV